jgi:SAM-dependent methyltransferase
MSLEKALNDYRQYFNEKIETHGATPKGVDYNGVAAQQVRFEQLIKVIDPSTPFSVIDFGCGYGALFDFLQSKQWSFDYFGYDMLEKMVVAGREAHQGKGRVHFTHLVEELPTCDYLLAGSIFNNKFGASNEDWLAMVLETLKQMNAKCRKGFSFDVLTNYSDWDRMAQRPDLFFADPLVLFDFCKRQFSRNVALLHDYGIYDFTIIVRKDG